MLRLRRRLKSINKVYDYIGQVIWLKTAVGEYLSCCFDVRMAGALQKTVRTKNFEGFSGDAKIVNLSEKL